MTGHPAQAGYTTSDVTVGEHSIRVYRAGEGNGRPLVFLHGSGPGVTALSNWEGAIQRLSARFDCIAPDVLGFGHSSHPEHPPQGMTAFTRARVQSIFGLLDALGLDQVDLIGNSMGGLFSLEMAIAEPRLIGRITLMGSGGIPFAPTPGLSKLITFYDEPTAEALARLMACFLYDPAAFGDVEALSRQRLDLAVRPEVRRSHLATFAGAPHAVDQQAISALQHPVMLIHGRDDQIIPVQVSLDLLGMLRNSHLHVLGECGHWSQLERPAEFDYLVTGFHDRQGL